MSDEPVATSALKPMNYTKRARRLARLARLLATPMSAIDARAALGGIGKSQFQRDLATLVLTHRVEMIRAGSRAGSMVSYRVTAR